MNTGGATVNRDEIVSMYAGLYVRGSEMHIADTLSRAYIPGKPSVHSVTFAEVDMTEGLSVSPRRLQELRLSTTWFEYACNVCHRCNALSLHVKIHPKY